MEKSFSRYDINCPRCDNPYLCQTVTHDYSVTVGLRRRTGPYACFKCGEVVDLNQAVKSAQIKQKIDELERMQEEVYQLEGKNDAAGNDIGVDVGSGGPEPLDSGVEIEDAPRRNRRAKNSKVD